MRRVMMFLNPLLIHTAKRRAAVEQIAELVSAHGSDVHLQETLSAHSAGQQARDAVAEGFDTFLVCGGDGTVFQVIQGLAGSGACLGVLPFGTGNVIAQNLRMPRNPLLAAHTLLDAEVRPVTLGKIELHPVGHKSKRSWYFLIAAGMGVHAALMNLAPMGQGKRRGGRLAYFVGGAKLLIGHPVQPFQMELTYEDGTMSTETACEAIAAHLPAINAWQAGGDPFADWLRLAWVPATGRMGLVHSSFHAMTGGNGNADDGNKTGWGDLPYPHYVRVRKMVCRPLDGRDYDVPLLVEADGEVLGAQYTAISVSEKKLNLLWPGKSPAH
jgi:diacylglycerol kinase (ATP)